MRPRIEKKCEQNTRKAKKKKIIGEKITKSLKILTSNIQKKKNCPMKTLFDVNRVGCPGFHCLSGQFCRLGILVYSTK